jgi:fructose-1,6-bisphosphatase II
MIAEDLLAATEQAAIAVWPLVGKRDKVAADQAAVSTLRQVLGKAPIRGRVVIGEGEMDEAPMLYRGEEVGRGRRRMDIAVDPLEGTNLTAKNQPGAVCVIAAGPPQSLLEAPDMMMQRLAGPPACRGRLSLDQPVEEMVAEVARGLGKDVSQVVVVMLDRDRHLGLMEGVLRAGARLRLISDGDVMPSVLAAIDGSDVDLVLGSGGAPEGVLAAVAIAALGGVFEGRLLPEGKDDLAAMASLGLKPGRVLAVKDVVSRHGVFCATSVTGGWQLDRPTVVGQSIWVHSLVIDGNAQTVRRIHSRYPSTQA